MPKYLKQSIQILLSLVLGVSIMYYLYQSQSESYLVYCSHNNIPKESCSLIDKLISDFGKLNYFWLIMIFVGFGMTNLSRMYRWNIILDTMGYQPKKINAFGAITLGYLANLALPRIGEFVRAGVLSKYEHVPFEKSLSSVALDRIADIISFFMLVTLTVFLDYEAFELFFSKYANFGGLTSQLYPLIGLLTGVIALYLFRSFWIHLPIIKKLKGFAYGLWEGILSIRNLKNPKGFILHTLLVWVWFYLMFVFAVKAFPAISHLGYIPMLVVYVFGSFGVFIPSPGGMGTYHFLVIISLGLYGINEADAFSFANIAFFSAQFMALIIYGIIFLILLLVFNKQHNKKVHSN